MLICRGLVHLPPVLTRPNVSDIDCVWTDGIPDVLQIQIRAAQGHLAEIVQAMLHECFIGRVRLKASRADELEAEDVEAAQLVEHRDGVFLLLARVGVALVDDPAVLRCEALPFLRPVVGVELVSFGVLDEHAHFAQVADVPYRRWFDWKCKLALVAAVIFRVTLTSRAEIRGFGIVSCIRVPETKPRDNSQDQERHNSDTFSSFRGHVERVDGRGSRGEGLKKGISRSRSSSWCCSMNPVCSGV